MVDNSGIKGIEEQDISSTRKSRRDARSMMSPQEKEMRRSQTVDKLKKDFKQVLPYVGQIGLDFKMGSGIAEFFGQQPDIVEGGKRPSYFEAAQRTSDLISEGKVTDAIVSGVDQTLTAVGGIGEGVMAAGVMLGPAGLPLLAGGWVANQISKRGKAILTNTKTGQRVLANFSGDTEKGFNIESIDVPKGREENQIIDTLGEVVDKNIVPVNKVDMTDADFESVPTPEQKIGQGTLKEAGFNPSQATAFWVQSGYSKAFPDLTRNEVANVLLDNPEVMKQSQDAISKMYTPTIKDGKEFFSVFRRVPLKGKEGLETDETIISGTLDPRVLPRYSVSSTMDQPESIIRDKKSKGAKLSEYGLPMELKTGFDPGKEIIIRYDVPKEKIIGYVPELVKASNTRGAKAKIEKTYDVKLDTDKNKLGFYKSLEKNAASEQEVFADVRGIQPIIIKDYEGGVEPLRGKRITEMILKSDKKTGAEILEDEGGIGRFNVLDDKFLEVPVDDPRSVFTSERVYSGKKFGNMPNPKYGKGAEELNENFEKANIEDLDKRLDFVKQEFNLNQLEKPDEGIKALESGDIKEKGITQVPTSNLEVVPLKGIEIMNRTDTQPLIKTTGKVKLNNILEYLENPNKRSITNQKDFDEMVIEAEEEIANQLKQQETGVDWYDGDIAKTMSLLDEVNPKFKDNGDAKDLVAFMTAIFSSGTGVGQDIKTAVQLVDHYLNTGKIVSKNPFNTYGPKDDVVKKGLKKVGDPKSWTRQTNEKALLFADAFIQDQGLSKFLEYIQKPTTRREASKLAEKYGLKKFEGRKDDPIVGANLFGPKIGKFMKNLMGIEGDENVADIWFTRMMNRRQGKMFFTPQSGQFKGQRLPIDQPQTVAEREAYDNFVNTIANKQGKNNRDIQAILWYFEQRLYTKLGVPSEPKKYSQAIESLLEQRRNVSDGSLSSSNVTKGTSEKRSQPEKKEKPTQLKKAQGGFIDRNTYDWVYTDG